MDDSELLAIPLYIPDATVGRMGGSGWLERWLCSGGVAMSHLVPGGPGGLRPAVSETGR
jgi:hypothetical protein